MKADIKEEVVIPEGVQVSVEAEHVNIKGQKGEVKRKLFDPKINVSVKDNAVHFSSKKATKRQKKIVGTFKAHVKNMMRGVNEPHLYKIKICSGHFPMNVSLQGNKLSIKNFLGEKVPREYVFPEGVDVKIDGDMITVTSASKELAGQASGALEQLTRITNRDRRIFQDGLYIIEKDGKSTAK